MKDLTILTLTIRSQLMPFSDTIMLRMCAITSVPVMMLAALYGGKTYVRPPMLPRPVDKQFQVC